MPGAGTSIRCSSNVAAVLGSRQIAVGRRSSSGTPGASANISLVPNVDVRGYQMLQLFPDDVTVGGVRVDLDVVQSDYLRNRPVWAARG
jgi:hypothetical protein